jgi:hypothetical protein
MKNDEIAAIIKQKAKRIEEIAQSKAVDELKDKIVADVMESTEKRNMLAKIARGEMIVTEGRKKRTADFYERLKAIEIDNKMSGDNAPEKEELSGELSFLNLLKESGVIDEGKGDSAH